MGERPTKMIHPVRCSGGAICQNIDGDLSDQHPRPAAILPGSFRPLHAGHRSLAVAAAHRLGCEVQFELSISNVDKPDLTDSELAVRLQQFVGLAAIWVTRSATFPAKATLFPGATFVLGYDTATRLIDPKYYGSEAARDDGLRKLLDVGCRVLVGGRIDSTGLFRTWIDPGSGFPELFNSIPEADFRIDLSSTELRARQREIKPT
jgi:hypothetical protein